MSRHRTPKRDILTLPYGLWRCDHGVEILFDREYKPRWHRYSGERANPMIGTERIKWNKQEYCYVGRVDLPLYRLLLKAEEEFIAGRPITLPVRPFSPDIMGGPKRATGPSEEPVAPTKIVANKAVLTLVVNNDGR